MISTTNKKNPLETMAMQQQWRAFSLTHITYPSHHHQYDEDAAIIIIIIGPLLALLSLTPPFAVCALTTAVLFYKDVIAAYLLVGSLFSAIVASILKQLVKQPRPSRYDDDDNDDAVVVEYGMPSNHSCFAWFGATFIILYVLRGGRGSSLVSYPAPPSTSSASFKAMATLWHHLHTGFTIAASLFIAIGCAYSRVYLGYHTTMQVYAGSALGTLLGIAWYGLFETSGVVRRGLIWLHNMLTELERTRRRRNVIFLEEDDLYENGMKNE
ncbi:hypothetical protein ACHAXR_007373 [Thalassiosira sp. AJA248-18]